MTTCHCTDLEGCFNAHHVARELATYRQQGAIPTTRRLIAMLQTRSLVGQTLLDIGSGLGAIPQALLRDGMSYALDVDASEAYLAVAHKEAERLGVAERIHFVHGNFVALAATIPAADIVTLDRVICCFADMPSLVGASAAHAKNLYGIVVPRDTWWVRLFGGIRNLLFALTRNPMRFYVHSIRAIDAQVRMHGLEQDACEMMGRWQILLYRHKDALAPQPIP